MAVAVVGGSGWIVGGGGTGDSSACGGRVLSRALDGASVVLAGLAVMIVGGGVLALIRRATRRTSLETRLKPYTMYPGGKKPKAPEAPALPE